MKKSELQRMIREEISMLSEAPSTLPYNAVLTAFANYTAARLGKSPDDRKVREITKKFEIQYLRTTVASKGNA